MSDPQQAQQPSAGRASGRGPGAALRSLTGVNEEVLATIPTERPRYTAMGGVVLGTAMMAMFSMSVALYCVFGGFSSVTFLFVPVWGGFILFLDRWLMSSTTGARFGERFLKLFPRFLLAVVLGVIIAEPLLLGVFHTAIEQRIKDDRAADLLKRESDLRRCNPVPGTKEAEAGADKDPSCEKLRLGVTTDSEAKQTQLDDLKHQAEELKKANEADAAAYAELENKARLECNGTPGPGFSGKFGQGPNCRRLRAEADRYRADHHIDESNQKLADLNGQIATLTKDIGDSRSTAAERIDQGIKDEVDKFRKNQKSDLGLLERLRALGDLVKESGYVFAAEWALRIFFIVVDSLPVLLKFMSGFTPYDRVIADRLRRQERTQRVASETERRTAVMQQELVRHQAIVEHAAARSKVDFDARIRYVDIEVMRESLTDARAAHLLDESPTIPLARVPADDAVDPSRNGRARR